MACIEWDHVDPARSIAKRRIDELLDKLLEQSCDGFIFTSDIKGLRETLHEIVESL